MSKSKNRYLFPDVAGEKKGVGQERIERDSKIKLWKEHLA